MRLSFGDYRSKMAAEDKRSSGSALKIRMSRAKPNKKSVFIRKAAFATSNNDFRFNFETPKIEEVAKEIATIKIQNDEHSECVSGVSLKKDDKGTCGVNGVQRQVFSLSDNSFRFNFDVS